MEDQGGSATSPNLSLHHLSQAAAAAAEVEAVIDSRFMSDRTALAPSTKSKIAITSRDANLYESTGAANFELKIDETSIHLNPYVLKPFQVKVSLLSTSVAAEQCDDEVVISTSIRFEDGTKALPSLFTVSPSVPLLKAGGTVSLSIKLGDGMTGVGTKKFVLIFSVDHMATKTSPFLREVQPAISVPLTAVRYRIEIVPKVNSDSSSNNNKTANRETNHAVADSEIWYKDEGGWESSLEFNLQLLKPDGRPLKNCEIPLDIVLAYANGQLVEKQDLLMLGLEGRPVIDSSGTSPLIRIRINDVSKNHQRQMFRILFIASSSSAKIPACEIGSAASHPIEVKSKRGKKRTRDSECPNYHPVKNPAKPNFATAVNDSFGATATSLLANLTAFPGKSMSSADSTTRQRHSTFPLTPSESQQRPQDTDISSFAPTAEPPSTIVVQQGYPFPVNHQSTAAAVATAHASAGIQSYYFNLPSSDSASKRDHPSGHVISTTAASASVLLVAPSSSSSSSSISSSSGTVRTTSAVAIEHALARQRAAGKKGDHGKAAGGSGSCSGNSKDRSPVTAAAVAAVPPYTLNAVPIPTLTGGEDFSKFVSSSSSSSSASSSFSSSSPSETSVSTTTSVDDHTMAMMRRTSCCSSSTSSIAVANEAKDKDNDEGAELCRAVCQVSAFLDTLMGRLREMQWTQIGYAKNKDGSINESQPLFAMDNPNESIDGICDQYEGSVKSSMQLLQAKLRRTSSSSSNAAPSSSSSPLITSSNTTAGGGGRGGGCCGGGGGSKASIMAAPATVRGGCCGGCGGGGKTSPSSSASASTAPSAARSAAGGCCGGGSRAGGMSVDTDTTIMMERRKKASMCAIGGGSGTMTPVNGSYPVAPVLKEGEASVYYIIAVQSTLPLEIATTATTTTQTTSSKASRKSTAAKKGSFSTKAQPVSAPAAAVVESDYYDNNATPPSSLSASGSKLRPLPGGGSAAVSGLPAFDINRNLLGFYREQIDASNVTTIEFLPLSALQADRSTIVTMRQQLDDGLSPTRSASTSPLMPPTHDSTGAIINYSNSSLEKGEFIDPTIYSLPRCGNDIVKLKQESFFHCSLVECLCECWLNLESEGDDTGSSSGGEQGVGIGGSSSRGGTGGGDAACSHQGKPGGGFCRCRPNCKCGCKDYLAIQHLIPHAPYVDSR